MPVETGRSDDVLNFRSGERLGKQVEASKIEDLRPQALIRISRSYDQERTVA